MFFETSYLLLSGSTGFCTGLDNLFVSDAIDDAYCRFSSYGFCDVLDTLLYSSGFFIKTVFSVEIVKTLVSLYNIKSYAGLSPCAQQTNLLVAEISEARSRFRD